MHENVSSREAERLELMPYSSATSLAIGPAMTMATVLLATATSATETSAATPSWADFLPLMILPTLLISQVSPP